MAVPKHITQISGLKAALIAGMEEWQFGFVTDNEDTNAGSAQDNAPCHSTSGVDEVLVHAMCKTIDPSTGAEEYLDVEFGTVYAGIESATSNDVVHPLVLSHTTTDGTPDDGMGVGAYFQAEWGDPYGVVGIGEINFLKSGNFDVRSSSFEVKTYVSGSYEKRIRVDYQGYFGIGSAITAGFDTPFHICLFSAGSVTAAIGTIATIENSNDAFLSFLTPNNKQSGIIFGDPDSSDVASIKYNHSTNCFTITGKTIAPTLPSGATQVAAGAAANELWVTSGHATLADNIVMRGV